MVRRYYVGNRLHVHQFRNWCTFFFFYFHFIAVVQRVCKMQLPNTIFTVFCNESVYKIACRKIMTTNRCNEHE